MIYLYIKTHNITGLKYLGKTKQDPFKYKGSGKRWRYHIRKHGNDVTTEVIGVFETNEQLRLVSEKLSKELDVVNSKNWANLKEELGDGGVGPYNHEANKRNSVLGGLARAKLKLSPGNKGKKMLPQSTETRQKKSASHKGMKRSYREDGSWFWIRPPSNQETFQPSPQLFPEPAS